MSAGKPCTVAIDDTAPRGDVDLAGKTGDVAFMGCFAARINRAAAATVTRRQFRASIGGSGPGRQFISRKVRYVWQQYFPHADLQASYPQPPKTFCATTKVQHAYGRWLSYRSGGESLQSTAYFVLTLLEGAAGGRKAAARLFQIDARVLKKLGT
jgi:hypothetical protein